MSAEVTGRALAGRAVAGRGTGEATTKDVGASKCCTGGPEARVAAEEELVSQEARTRSGNRNTQTKDPRARYSTEGTATKTGEVLQLT